MIPDHYATLGIADDASPAEIRAARRRLLRRHHPDAATGSVAAAEARTRAILVAGEILLDPRARAEYDAALSRIRRVRGIRGGTFARSPSAPRDLTCPGCLRVNARTTRHACIYCGEGIGDTPRPVRVTPMAREVAGRSPLLDLVAGALLGTFAGAIAMLAIPWSDQITGEIALMMMGLPALSCALVASLAADRVHDWISDHLPRRA